MKIHIDVTRTEDDKGWEWTFDRLDVERTCKGTNSHLEDVVRSLSAELKDEIELAYFVDVLGAHRI